MKYKLLVIFILGLVIGAALGLYVLPQYIKPY